MNLYSFFSYFNHFLTFYFVFPAILVLSVFLTIKLKCLQITKMKLSVLSLFKSNKKGIGNISHYEAVSAVIAGNLGTGNISGMAIALSMGGPGSLVWMWLMAFLGSIIQYSSCYLGIKYRIKNASGEYIGGPMYYLKNGLGLNKLAVCFSGFTILAAILVGNFAQVNSAILPMKALGVDPLLCSFGIMVLAALVILGGLQRVAKVASSVVPAMAILYIGTGLIVLFFYRGQLIPAIFLMLKSSVQLSSFAGGALGFGLMKALSTGIERGVFATDAGTGVVSILQSGARSQHPVLDGVVTLVAPFLVMLICTMTGLILIVTGAFEQSGLQSTNMVVFAFQKVFGETAGMTIVFCSLFLFAYTTILSWGGCAEKAVEFLWNKKKSKLFQYFYLALIPIGSMLRVDLIWVLADLSITLMLLTNLIGVAGLSKEVVAGSYSFFGKTESINATQEVD